MIRAIMSGGRDPPGVTLQRMLLKELELESTDCCFFTPETILNSHKRRHFIQEKCAESTSN